VTDTEMMPAASRDMVVREICERHAPVLVERALAKRVLASKGEPWYSTVLERVVTEWRLREQGTYFDIYEPPTACLPPMPATSTSGRVAPERETAARGRG